MPTDNRPLRDVLRDVEKDFMDGRSTPEAVRLARELRAIAPLMREAVRELKNADCYGGYPFALGDKLRALANELEEK